MTITKTAPGRPAIVGITREEWDNLPPSSRRTEAGSSSAVRLTTGRRRRSKGANRREMITIAAISDKEKLERILNSKLPTHIKENVRRRRTSIKYTYTILKQLEDRDKSHPLPAGQYDVVLVDPPWKMDADTHEEGRILEMLPNVPMAAKDAILFMWANAYKLEAAIKVIKTWGFKYKTHSVWIRKEGPLPIDDGYLKPQVSEDLLVGVKGKGIGVPYPACRRPSVFGSDVERSHVYELIESMFPNHTYLELFARDGERRNGWTRIMRRRGEEK